MIDGAGGDISFRGLLCILKQDLSTIQAAGLRLHPQSRFCRLVVEYEQALRAQAREIPDDAVNWLALAKGFCDIWELHRIAHHVEFFMGHRDDLQRVLDGVVAPQPEKDRRPRDYQFQLCMTSLVLDGGFQAELAEPDLTFQYGASRCGMAVKRVKSLKTLEERLKDAKSQIEKSDLPGFIALAVDQGEVIERQHPDRDLSPKAETLRQGAKSQILSVREKLFANATHRVDGIVLIVTPAAVFPALSSVGFHKSVQYIVCQKGAAFGPGAFGWELYNRLKAAVCRPLVVPG